MPAVILGLQDLYNRVPANVINGYFDDDGDGVVSEGSSVVQDLLMSAEGELFSRVLRAYPGNPLTVQGAMQKLVINDPTLRQHLGWVACELACERRTEFCDQNGNGAYKVQYDRALVYFENISKGILRSPAEYIDGVGQGANTGGNQSPLADSIEANFTFAPSKSSPFGHGGF